MLAMIFSGKLSESLISRLWDYTDV